MGWSCAGIFDRKKKDGAGSCDFGDRNWVASGVLPDMRLPAGLVIGQKGLRSLSNAQSFQTRAKCRVVVISWHCHHVVPF